MSEYIQEEAVTAEPQQHGGIHGWLVMAGDGRSEWMTNELFRKVCRPVSPTPEPVAVEDVTSGWYWLVDDRLTCHASIHGKPGGNTVYWLSASGAAEDIPVEDMEDTIKWYRAPSPEQLMAMCRDQKPQLCVDCTQIKPDGEPCPLRGKRTDPRLCGNRCPMFQEKDEKTTRDHKATIATAVRILREKWRGEDAQNKCADELESMHGSRVPTSEELECAEKLHVAGWTVTYNDEVIGTTTDPPRITPAIATCGQCGNLRNIKEGKGACTISLTMDADNVFAGRCLHATPKPTETKA